MESIQNQGVKFNSSLTAAQAKESESKGTIHFTTDERIVLNGVDFTGVKAVTTGSTNGTVSVDGTDVAVQGLGSAAYTQSTAYATAAQGTKADNALPNTTTYAASSTVGGSATSAEKVNNTLTIGTKAFDGSAAVTVTAADLGLSTAMHFAGVSTTDPKEGPATVDGYTSWSKGDVVLYGNKEFVLNGDTNNEDNWVELGDESAYAVKATTLAGYGITDAYTKTETGIQITNAINGLNGNLNSTTPDAGKTLTGFSQTNGVVSATFGDISITKSQVSDFPEALPASDVTDTYSSTGKVPVSGTAVASAISNLARKATTLAGYGITDGVVANTPITGATHTKITYDAKGLVTEGADLAASDIPELSTDKITSGTFADERIASADVWNQAAENAATALAACTALIWD